MNRSSDPLTRVESTGTSACATFVAVTQGGTDVKVGHHKGKKKEQVRRAFEEGHRPSAVSAWLKPWPEVRELGVGAAVYG